MTQTQSHFIVISVATTGLVTHTHTPKLLEIAARLVFPGDAKVSGAGRFSALVSHPPAQLRSSEAVQAQRFHGITPDLSSTGFPEEEVIASFNAWRQGIVNILFNSGSGLAGWRAYNRDFVSAVLACPTWMEALGPGAPGRCVMEEASEVMGAHGALPASLDGSFRFPSMAHTARWLRERGHAVREKDKRPRAGATCVAEICVALAHERRLLTWSSAS